MANAHLKLVAPSPDMQRRLWQKPMGEPEA
jgi:hypothetical protein